jgi:acetylornithine/N-succinyldiaminopimelate aminotransferase
MEKAFHGRTMATLSATGNRKAQAGFEPLVSGFVRVPYNDLEAIRAIARYNKNIVAVMLEIVQGEGGINIADVDFQRGLRALCDDRGWLLICDEVQCGMGRTGSWFAFQHAGIRPDVVTLAKGLGGGVPIGACLTAGRRRGCSSPAITVRPSVAINWRRPRPDDHCGHREDGLIDNALAVGAADP